MILVYSDDARQTAILSYTLQQYNFAVISANNIYELRDMGKNATAILVDVDRLTTELLNAIQEIRKTCDVSILITCYIRDEITISSLHGIDMCMLVAKPVDMQLVLVVHQEGS